MKRKLLLLGLVVIILTVAVSVFFHKKNLDFELVCKVPSKDGIYPDAYVFLHSEQALKEYGFLNERTQKIINKCGSDFNFSKYSYVICYGRPVAQMYHSYKTTCFDDKSAGYAKMNGKNVVFMDYGDSIKNSTPVYIYRLKNDSSLRGFYGI